MGFLDDIMATDNQFGFTDLDTFGETITYYPFGGASRSIKVVIDRGVPTTADEDEAQIKEVSIVFISNHATLGISSAVFNSKDKIEFAYRIGTAARQYILGNPISIDAAGMLFRVK